MTKRRYQEWKIELTLIIDPTTALPPNRWDWDELLDLRASEEIIIDRTTLIGDTYFDEIEENEEDEK